MIKKIEKFWSWKNVLTNYINSSSCLRQWIDQIMANILLFYFIDQINSIKISCREWQSIIYSICFLFIVISQSEITFDNPFQFLFFKCIQKYLHQENGQLFLNNSYIGTLCTFVWWNLIVQKDLHVRLSTKFTSRLSNVSHPKSQLSPASIPSARYHLDSSWLLLTHLDSSWQDVCCNDFVLFQS